MALHSPLRSLLLSLVVAVTGGSALLDLTPTAGDPTIRPGRAVARTVDAHVVAVAANPVPTAPAALAGVAASARVAPAPLALTASLEVLRAQRAAGLDCELSAAAVPLCLHGQDHEPAHLAGTGNDGATGTTGAVGCYGDGTSGPRVRAVYARPQSSPNRYASSLGAIRGWAAGVSRTFDNSAARTGGRRHVRFATTAGPRCVVTVLDVVLPDAAFGSFRATIDALEARGLDAPASKYLVWADAAGYCGMGTTYADDRPGPDNLNNGRFPAYSRIDRRCWGRVETHELVHMLGGVQRSAPHATRGFHCTDGYDLMCYDDGVDARQRSVCSPTRRELLDCRNDDYFSTAAPRGSYLQTHWNTARSTFLAPALTDPAATPQPAVTPAAPPSPSPSPSSSPSPSPSPAGPLPVVGPLPTLAATLLPVPELLR